MLPAPEMLILTLLDQNRVGLYAPELISKSNGALNRGSIYQQLGLLAQRGLIASDEEPPTEPDALPRYKHRVTETGIQNLADGMTENAWNTACPGQAI